jgi:glyoxylase-like metal-dependent hydrolase (beta-lactamase superfamily II)
MTTAALADTLDHRSDPTCWICVTCGLQHAASATPPASCAVCQDDRQYVGLAGQQWTTHAQLAERLHVRVEDDDGLLGIGTVEPFAIPQRALVVRDAEATVMWDCISVVTTEAVERLGPVDVIAISHPHFYSSMVEWSDAFGGVPILVHAADRDWIARSSAAVQLWDGDRHEVSAGITLVHLPGHFPGSSVLWSHGGDRPALLVGDSLHVTADRRHVTVMHSVPNFIPVGPGTIEDVRRNLDGLEFDDLYGFTWGLNVIGGARRAVDESLDRYLAAIR